MTHRLCWGEKISLEEVRDTSLAAALSEAALRVAVLEEDFRTVRVKQEWDAEVDEHIVFLFVSLKPGED